MLRVNDLCPMRRGQIRRVPHLAALCLAGSLVLALATWACLHFSLNAATTGFGFLVVIVLLSLFDGSVSSALFSIIAVGCLNSFFMAPPFSFTVAGIENVATLAAFLITSSAITGLMRRLRRLGGPLMNVIAARRADEKLHKAQVESAHVIGLKTLGEQAASLAHKITQPIGSARSHASAAVNFLDKQPLDLGEVREALGCIGRGCGSGRGIINRVRKHIKKAPPRRQRFGPNAPINEVIMLTRSAINRTGVSVRTGLTEWIDRHGGRGLAEANEPRSAVFQFTLPAAPMESHHIRAQREGTLSGAFHQLTC